MQGATVVISPSLQAAEKLEITHASLIPTQLYRWMQEPKLKCKELKCLLLGGAPIPHSLKQSASHRHLPLVLSYGMTEMASTIALSARSGDPSYHLLAHREMKIERDNEIWVRGKTLFEGYWDPIAQEVAKRPKEEWFPTNDLGKTHTDGSIEVIGRKDRQFISGGENIQPEEIEKALCAIHGIRQACVLPLEDPEFGSRPCALIDDATSCHTLQSIQEALKPHLPAFKHPIAILPYPKEEGIKPDLTTLHSPNLRFQNRP